MLPAHGFISNDEEVSVMENEIEYKEKRRYRRFLAKPGTFAVFCYNSLVPGRIIDISRGGMAFCYVDEVGNMNDMCELDILYGEDNFYLDKIPFETVSDCVITDGEKPGEVSVGQRGIRFGNLSPNQRALLDHFIEKNTIG